MSRFVDFSGQIAPLSNPASFTAFSLVSGSAGFATIAPEADKSYHLTVSGEVSFDSGSGSSDTNDFGFYFGDPSNVQNGPNGLSILTTTSTRPSSAPYTIFVTYDLIVHIDSAQNKYFISPTVVPGVSGWVFNPSLSATSGSLSTVSPNISFISRFSNSHSGNTVSLSTFRMTEL